jgi:hypothetical protein
MDARTVRGHDAQQAAALLVAKFEVPHDEQILERRVLGEAAHPLEADPRLIPRRGADRDHRPGRRAEVVNADLRGERGLGVAARQDGDDLAR